MGALLHVLLVAAAVWYGILLLALLVLLGMSIRTRLRERNGLRDGARRRHFRVPFR